MEEYGRYSNFKVVLLPLVYICLLDSVRSQFTFDSSGTLHSISNLTVLNATEDWHPTPRNYVEGRFAQLQAVLASAWIWKTSVFFSPLNSSFLLPTSADTALYITVQAGGQSYTTGGAAGQTLINQPYTYPGSPVNFSVGGPGQDSLFGTLTAASTNVSLVPTPTVPKSCAHTCGDFPVDLAILLNSDPATLPQCAVTIAAGGSSWDFPGGGCLGMAGAPSSSAGTSFYAGGSSPWSSGGTAGNALNGLLGSGGGFQAPSYDGTGGSGFVIVRYRIPMFSFP